MSPWVLLAGVLLAIAGAGGAYWQGRQDGRAAAESEAAREERLVTAAVDQAASAAATAIARTTVRHVTIRQEAEREIQTRVEYRDCRHGAEQLQRINAALQDGAPADAAGGGQLPASAAAR